MKFVCAKFNGFEPFTAVLQSKQSAGGVIPQGLRLGQTIQGDRGLMLLLDRDRSVGYYSETLGFWPLGYQQGVKEEFRLWIP